MCTAHACWVQGKTCAKTFTVKAASIFESLLQAGILTLFFKETNLSICFAPLHKYGLLLCFYTIQRSNICIQEKEFRTLLLIKLKKKKGSSITLLVEVIKNKLPLTKTSNIKKTAFKIRWLEFFILHSSTSQTTKMGKDFETPSNHY